MIDIHVVYTRCNNFDLLLISIDICSDILVNKSLGFVLEEFGNVFFYFSFSPNYM